MILQIGYMIWYFTFKINFQLEKPPILYSLFPNLGDSWGKITIQGRLMIKIAPLKVLSLE